MGNPVRIGVDVGGTFTDVVVVRESTGEVVSLKTPSTPGRLLDGILQGLSKAAGRIGTDLAGLLRDCRSFVHGTTVCTNMTVQRSGAKVGLLTTEGFRDTLAIRRGARSSIWDIAAPTPPDLVPRHLRLGVRERMDCFGVPLEPLEPESVEKALDTLKSHGVEAVAICLFNAYLNGEHERALKGRACERIPDVPVLISSEVLPVMGEYERVSTAVINAYVAPGAASYLGDLDAALKAHGLRVEPLLIQGNGGVNDIKRSLRQPGSLILSGPAAVAAAALRYKDGIGASNLLVFDMGGTSCDITVVADGRVSLTDILEIDGYHLAAPSLEISTIGTGGGTVAYVDPGGMLRVGPRGAGADPGPVCYGRGGQEPTVTDANLILGRLSAHSLLGGEMTLDPVQAEEVIRQKIAEPLGLTPQEAARAILRVANQNMISALEMISVKKGRDPREFALVAAGGAGPLHASALAGALGITRVFVPRDAAVFSALGLLHADLRRDYVQSFIGDLGTTAPESLKEGFRQLMETARDEFREMGVPAEKVNAEPIADLRYRGQHWEIPVPLPGLQCPDPLGTLEAAFHERHEILYGHRDPEGVVEILKIRVTATAPTPPLKTGERVSSGPVRAAGPEIRRDVYLDEPGPPVSVPVIAGSALRPGERLLGPVIIEEPTLTLWVSVGDTVEKDAQGNYLLSKERA
ncbi:MAG: hydantoinase/oxoprolinase family protein [Candidatus Tectomicrobia bacterium]|nr:hydantoinase/oxoprolinase family protein [Candidatus Tectomicrobia bacterium]